MPARPLARQVLEQVRRRVRYTEMWHPILMPEDYEALLAIAEREAAREARN